MNEGMVPGLLSWQPAHYWLALAVLPWPLLSVVLMVLCCRRMLRQQQKAAEEVARFARSARPEPVEVEAEVVPRTSQAAPAAAPAPTAAPTAPAARPAPPSPAAPRPETRESSFLAARPDLAAHFRRWGESARSTAPLDRAALEKAVHGLYAAAGRKAPRIVIAPSPLAMMIAYGLASALVWARKHPGSSAQPEAMEAARRAGGRFVRSDLAKGAIDDLRLAVVAKSRSTWELAQRILQPEIGRMQHESTLHLDADVADAVRGYLRELVMGRGSPATEAQWEAGSSVHAAAADAALQAACGNCDEPDAPWTLNSLLAWIGCCTFTSEPQLRAYLQDGFFDTWLHRALWTPLRTEVPMIGAMRYLMDEPGVEFERFKRWEDCALEMGDLLPHSEFCIASERPEQIRLDAQGLLHCADGPSVRWRDGWSLFHWHGVQIPPDREYVITSPQSITVDAIDHETNAQMRSVMTDRFGADRYVLAGGATVVHTLPADHEFVGLRGARLLSKTGFYGGEPVICIELVDSTPGPDGTCKRYVLRVDPRAYGGRAARDCHAAAASTWRRADGSLAYANYTDYRPAAES
jgi:hypothetical protein